jgi:dUTP pyrophosphatase
MNIKVKKLHKDTIIPSYAKEGDAGMDLTAVSVEFTQDYVSYKTGLAIEIPYGYVGLLFPRSSNSKKDMILSNSVGVVDSGYRGEIELRFKIIKSTKDSNSLYNIGDRVGQLIILPIPHINLIESDSLSTSVRGEDGFGSTNL